MKVTTIAVAFVAVLLLFSGGPRSSAAAPQGRAAPHISRGDPAAGRATFSKLRCDTCHTVYGEKSTKAAPHPLRDLSGETPDAVANLIAERTELAPEALFDEQVMSLSASGMTQRQLADLVAYLRVKR